ncbi:MAG: hypothetical protein HC880_08935 [Bacteroidia bacterium]|nr:hypothetical protein [Bacteroidia bacterium]
MQMSEEDILKDIYQELTLVSAPQLEAVLQAIRAIRLNSNLPVSVSPEMLLAYAERFRQGFSLFSGNLLP